MKVVDAVVERFAHHSPVTLMVRLALQRAFDPRWIDEVVAQHAHHQYVRELLFSTTVELMSLVAVGLRPSLHAAAQAAGAALPVSITALYGKVDGTEPALVRALVAGSAQGLAPVIAVLQRGRPALALGWRVRILFERFWLGDTSRGRTGRLGLGLSIDQHIVQRHGGELGASSAGVGHGATFTLTLPAKA
jgi:hypothetical protein